LVFEEGSCELDSISFGDGSEDAKLLHLEDPCFQGFCLAATEWWWSVRFDARRCWGSYLYLMLLENVVLCL